MFTKRFLNLLHGRLALINLEVCALELASFCRDRQEEVSCYWCSSETWSSAQMWLYYSITTALLSPLPTSRPQSADQDCLGMQCECIKVIQGGGEWTLKIMLFEISLFVLWLQRKSQWMHMLEFTLKTFGSKNTLTQTNCELKKGGWCQCMSNWGKSDLAAAFPPG